VLSRREEGGSLGGAEGVLAEVKLERGEGRMPGEGLSVLERAGEVGCDWGWA
jgi:hypothetical protein